MNAQVQTFSAPDGTPMVVLAASEYERLLALSDEGMDRLAATAALNDLRDGVGTMPGPVLDIILDEGITAVAAWRRYRGMSQSELASSAGLSQVFVSKIERGDSHGSPQTRAALASALQAPLWTLEEPLRLNNDMVSDGPRHMSLVDQIIEITKAQSGLTAREIAKELHGSAGYQQQVNSRLLDLIQHRRLLRKGRGGNGDPFKYFAV